MVIDEIPIGAREILPDFPGYWATTDGRIISTLVPTSLYVMNTRPDASGYVKVTMRTSAGRRVTRETHRLICEAFHGLPPSDKMKAMHLDGDKSNNAPANLEWGTHSENLLGARRDAGRPRLRRSPLQDNLPPDAVPIRYSEPLRDLFITPTGELWTRAWGRYRQLFGSVNDKGYRQITYSRVNEKFAVLYVHRLVCFHFHGAPPDGKNQVRHLNGRPSNNHPHNLAWGDGAEQNADRRCHGTGNTGRSKRPRKLSDEQIAEMRAKRAMGASCKELAVEYGVHPGFVSAVCTGSQRRSLLCLNFVRSTDP